MSGTQQQSSQVPFQQAIQELQSIFGGFDKDIIETILRQNKGHMEKTIDTLLEMNGEKPINENPEADHNVAQIEQDEDLARMLQNELFINQLRNDEDFSSLFNNSDGNSGVNRSEQTQRQSMDAIRQERIRRDREGFNQFQQRKLQQQQQQQQQHSYSDDDVEEDVDDGPSALDIIEEDIQELKEKFNQLGEAAKTKFKELTNMFLTKEEVKYEPVKTKEQDINNQVEEDDEEVIVYDKYNKTTHHRNVNNHNSNNNNNNNNNSNIFSDNNNNNNSYTTNRRNYTNTSTINDSNNYSITNSESEDEFDSFILESDRNRNVNRLRTINSSYGDHKKQD